ncbi:MAG: TonB-dependent receptor, partial [Bacteroidota bacterium]
GASSVLYGSSALGGVINVITADAPDTAKTSIRLLGTMFGKPGIEAWDWDGDESAKEGSINVFHSRKIGNHDLTVLGGLTKETGWRHDTESEQGRLMVMTKFRPKSIPGLNWGINASARFDSSQTYLFWDTYLPADTTITFTLDTVFNSLGAYSGQGSARGQLNTRYTIDPFVKYLTKKNNIHYYRGRWMRTVNTNNTDQSNRNALVYNDYQFTTTVFDGRATWVSGFTNSLNFANGDSLYQGSHLGVNTAVYTQMDVAVTDKLNATFGGRFDHINIDGTINEASPVFRIGANYTIAEGTNVRASIGQAFRSPSVAERYTATNASGLIIIPNEELQVEKGYSAEIGFRQGFLAGNKKRNILGFVDVAGFTMRYDNMIEFGVAPFQADPDSFQQQDFLLELLSGYVPEFQARNVSEARITGVEGTMLFQAQYDKLFFTLNGGVTYINPQNLNPVVDSQQVDLLNTVGPQDSVFNFDAFGQFAGMALPDFSPDKLYDNPAFLKYRSRWTNRFSATVGYGRYSLTANYRYKSQIETIDQFLFIAIPGSADWVKENPQGFTVVDFVLGARLIDGMKLSLHLNNAFNEAWTVLPGIVGKQRHYSAQLKYVF